MLEKITLVCWFWAQPICRGIWIRPFVDGKTSFRFKQTENRLILFLFFSFSFEQRVYVPLPGVEERASMFKTHLGTTSFHTIKDDEWMKLAEGAEK